MPIWRVWLGLAWPVGRLGKKVRFFRQDCDPSPPPSPPSPPAVEVCPARPPLNQFSRSLEVYIFGAAAVAGRLANHTYTHRVDAKDFSERNQVPHVLLAIISKFRKVLAPLRMKYVLNKLD